MNPNEYISKRLAELHQALEDSHEKGFLRCRISELEAMQAHLSESTRPEVSIGGQYSVAEGQTCWYLMRQGFYLARSMGAETLEQFHQFASDLNQLEALRVSHGELVRASKSLLKWIDCNCDPSAKSVQDLRIALSATKTPTAAPQGQH